MANPGILIDFRAQTAQFKTAVEDATKTLQNFSNSIPSVKSALDGLMGTFASVGLTIGGAYAFKSMIEGASRAEQNVIRLRSQVQAMGTSAAMSANQMVKLASELSKATNFSKGQIMGAETALNPFSLGPDTYKRALKVATEMAAQKDSDPAEMAAKLGYALQKPEEGIGRLAREFGQLDPATEKAITHFAELGETAKAQGLILDFFASKTGNVAEQLHNSFAGRVIDAQRRLDEFGKAVGVVLMGMVDWVLGNQSVISILAGLAAGILTVVVALKAWAVASTIVKALSGPAGWVQLAVGLTAAAAAGVALGSVFETIKTSADGASGSIGDVTKSIEEMDKKAQKEFDQKTGWSEFFRYLNPFTDKYSVKNFNVPVATPDSVKTANETAAAADKASQKLLAMRDALKAQAADFGLDENAKKFRDAWKIALENPSAANVKAFHDISDTTDKLKLLNGEAEANKRILEFKKEIAKYTTDERTQLENGLKQAGASQASIAEALRNYDKLSVTKFNAKAREVDAETRQSLRESTRTPLEKAREEIEGIMDQHRKGLDRVTTQRALNNVFTQAQSTIHEPPAIAALEKGTSAAFSQSLKNASADKLNEQLEELRKQTKAQLDTVTAINKLPDNIASLMPKPTSLAA